jgi:tetratricopeptide (TPR) repeat protein
MALLVLAAGIAFQRERKPSLVLATPLAAIERALDAKHLSKRAARLRERCREHDCDCAAEASSAGLDVEALDAVVTILGVSARCQPRGPFDGIRAEALVRKNDPSGMKESGAVLAKSPNDPHALYAQALFGYRLQQFDAARGLAERSRAAGRGTPAVFLAGLVEFAANDLDGARSQFRAVLAAEPEDVDALFNLGVIAQRQERYGEARANYLRVTRLAPSHENARYHLAILAHSIGAADEARHHLAKFRALGATADRVRTLETELARPPAKQPARVLRLGAADDAPAP